MRTAVLASLGLWIGATLLLSELRWFKRPRLAERLRAYHPGTPDVRSGHLLSASSFRDVIGPLSRALGERIAKVFGVGEDLARRLERIHSPLDVTAFRVRQVGWAAAALIAALVLALAVQPPVPAVLLLVLGLPLLTFLVLRDAGARRRARNRPRATWRAAR